MLNDVSANKIEEVSAAVIKEEVEKPSVAPTEVTSATNVTSIGADKDATVDTVNVENAAADMKVEENKSKAVDQVKEKKPVEVVSDNYKVPILDQSEPTASVSGENEFVADNDKVQFLSNEVPTLDQIKPLASGSGDNVEKLVDADKKEDEKPAE
uniref:Uncharacterized protein n=1 Tax=Panagrolaimus sp. ES5 TaxID=591445 RepID=A0AC34GMB8_9BILA